jgi:hypothetical protein
MELTIFRNNPNVSNNKAESIFINILRYNNIMENTTKKNVNASLIENICIDNIKQYNSILEIEKKFYVADISTFFLYVVFRMIDKEELNMRQEFFVLCSIDLSERTGTNEKITRTIFYKIGFLRQEFAEILNELPQVMVEIVNTYNDYKESISEFNNHLKNYVNGYELGFEVEFDTVNFKDYFTNDSIKKKEITR